MNEQIRELADRLWRVHPKDIDAMGLKTRTEFYEHELKKFAELIVRECLNQCYNRGMNDELYAGQLKAAEYIEQHFGVE